MVLHREFNSQEFDADQVLNLVSYSVACCPCARMVLRNSRYHLSSYATDFSQLSDMGRTKILKT